MRAWHITSMQEYASTLRRDEPSAERHGDVEGPALDSSEDHTEPGVRTCEELPGEIAFVSPEAQQPRTAELLGAGAIVVAVGAPPASMRGRLAEFIDDAIERQLGVHDAPSPYLTAWSAMPDEADERLADQLARARSVGATGLAIVMGSLSRIAAPALTPEDSATLRMLARTCARAAVVVLMDDGDVRVGAFGEAVELGRMLGGGESQSESESESESQSVSVGGGLGEGGGDGDEEVAEIVETHVDAPVVIVDEGEKGRHAARRRATAATAGVPAVGPGDFWRSWAIALGAARGPQPLAAFEKLFTESYMPLANAIAAGVDDPRAIRAHDEFRDGFDRSYTDAFAAFGATGRRPRLVMDAFDVANRQARLHGARTTHVLVVDAMRYDIGCHVRDDIAARAAASISLTSESLLWSALPTTTYRQLETLARGMDALRAPAPEDSTDSLRGRSAETVRRMRVGSRELFKLDVVPAMLGALTEPARGSASPSATPSATVIAALRDVATNVADAIMRHVETLPPRTLLFVLGDHGFAVDRRGRISDGGASPEEVLVPSLAYLVGELH